jgi:hypothetical protein
MNQESGKVGSEGIGRDLLWNPFLLSRFPDSFPFAARNLKSIQTRLNRHASLSRRTQKRRIWKAGKQELTDQILPPFESFPAFPLS